MILTKYWEGGKLKIIMTKFSEDRKKQVVDMYVGGMTAEEVHEATGHARRTVTRWVEELGYPVYLETDRVKDHEGLRTCIQCNKEQLLEDAFYKNGPSGQRMWSCKECVKLNKRDHYLENQEDIKALRREDRKKNPRRHRQYDMKKRFKIGYEEFDKLFSEQGSVCAGCGTTESGQESGEWHIDHDHGCCPARGKTCGKCIRGILCRACNLTLGNAQDSIERLRGLADYLEHYQENRTG